MSKKLLSLFLVLTMLLTACSGSSKSFPDPTDGSSSSKDNLDFSSVYKGLEDKIYTIQFEPISGSSCNKILAMDVLPGYDAAWLPESLNTENFYIMREEDQKIYATANFYTAPANLSEFYKTDDPVKIHEEMISTYFPVMDVHDGLLKNATEDFGHKIITDWTGKFGEYDYSLIEFQNADGPTHSIRFLVGNSEINEKYWSFEFRADIPSSETEIIEDYRSMLLSLFDWDN